MPERSIVEAIGNRLDALFPSIVLDNRGYVLMLIPACLLWGIGGALVLVWTGDPQSAQELVNGSVYISIAIGAVSLGLRAWRDASMRKLKVVIVWSPVGLLTYVLLGGGIVGLLTAVLSVWMEQGASRTELTFFLGGLATMYAWYRTNRWAFRLIRASAQSG